MFAPSKGGAKATAARPAGGAQVGAPSHAATTTTSNVGRRTSASPNPAAVGRGASAGSKPVGSTAGSTAATTSSSSSVFARRLNDLRSTSSAVVLPTSSSQPLPLKEGDLSKQATMGSSNKPTTPPLSLQQQQRATNALAKRASGSPMSDGSSSPAADQRNNNNHNNVTNNNTTKKATSSASSVVNPPSTSSSKGSANTARSSSTSSATAVTPLPSSTAKPTSSQVTSTAPSHPAPSAASEHVLSRTTPVFAPFPSTSSVTSAQLALFNGTKLERPYTVTDVDKTFYDHGVYICVRCRNPIAKATSKVPVGNGLGGFQEIIAGHVSVTVSLDLLETGASCFGEDAGGVARLLVHCSGCKGFLGTRTQRVPNPAVPYVTTGEVYFANFSCLHLVPDVMSSTSSASSSTAVGKGTPSQGGSSSSSIATTGAGAPPRKTSTVTVQLPARGASRNPNAPPQQAKVASSPSPVPSKNPTASHAKPVALSLLDSVRLAAEADDVDDEDDDDDDESGLLCEDDFDNLDVIGTVDGAEQALAKRRQLHQSWRTSTPTAAAAAPVTTTTTTSAGSQPTTVSYQQRHALRMEALNEYSSEEDEEDDDDDEGDDEDQDGDA